MVERASNGTGEFPQSKRAEPPLLRRRPDSRQGTHSFVDWIRGALGSFPSQNARVRRYSIYSIKDGGDRRTRGISELRCQESTPWTHKSLVFKRQLISQAGRRGFESRLPLQLLKELRASPPSRARLEHYLAFPRLRSIGLALCASLSASCFTMKCLDWSAPSPAEFLT